VCVCVCVHSQTTFDFVAESLDIEDAVVPIPLDEYVIDACDLVCAVVTVQCLHVAVLRDLVVTLCRNQAMQQFKSIDAERVANLTPTIRLERVEFVEPVSQVRACARKTVMCACVVQTHSSAMAALLSTSKIR
jgi:hypothetical protein